MRDLRNEGDVFARIIPWILSLFLLVGWIPMIDYPTNTLSNMLNEPLASSLYYFVVGLFFVVFMVVAYIHMKKRPAVRFLIIFLVMLIYSLIVYFLHESKISVDYGDGALVTYSLDVGFSLAYAAEIIYDLIFAFGFIFLWPYQKRDPKNQWVFPLVVVAIGLASSIYGYVRYYGSAVSSSSGGNNGIFTSFYSDNVEYGKIIFVSTFSCFILAYSFKGWIRGLLIFLGLYFVSVSLTSYLSVAFFSSAVALFLLAISVIVDARKKKDRHSFLAISSYIYMACLLTFILLLCIPSSVSTYLQARTTEPFSKLFMDRCDRWAGFFSNLSGYRIFVGDGLMGYFRDGFYAGNANPSLSALNNGFIEAFDAGGVVYLLFYLFLVFISFSSLARNESHNSSFFTMMISFTVGFLLYSMLSNERLLFSSHYASFVASYLFCCYSSKGTMAEPIIDEPKALKAQ
ncbi:MAG: hypothetical protein LKF75_04765 [Bacilli bacterium]|jgi:uncharacterized membrane protein YdcZ (DUF606 family)|nr:hypothetical protein [Bacilli bacterium]MCH4228985.1 hypothetical protein [Bacilli bacterium]